MDSIVHSWCHVSKHHPNKNAHWTDPTAVRNNLRRVKDKASLHRLTVDRWRALIQAAISGWFLLLASIVFNDEETHPELSFSGRPCEENDCVQYSGAVNILKKKKLQRPLVRKIR